MSYDLMIFVPCAAPEGRQAFMDWYVKITEWGEGHDYNDPANTAPVLQAWYRDMIPEFPAMNGPDGVSENDPSFDTPRITGYTCAKDAIYVDFRWDVADEAYERSLKCAAIHGVGFFDVNADDGAVWMPTSEGYRVVHGGSAEDRKIEQLMAEFLSGRS